MSPWRILLAYPGGEIELHAYRVAVPLDQARRKVMEFLGKMTAGFRECRDSETGCDIPAWESQDGKSMVLLAAGPSGADPFL